MDTRRLVLKTYPASKPAKHCNTYPPHQSFEGLGLLGLSYWVKGLTWCIGFIRYRVYNKVSLRL